MSTESVNQTVDRLVRAAPLTTDRFAALLGAPLKPGEMNPFWNTYTFELLGGPFARGELRLNAAGNRVDSDGVKLVAGTMAKEVADRAIQVLGAYGYVAEGVVERLWRDSKMVEIGGGTVEAHQKNIARDLTRTADLVLR